MGLVCQQSRAGVFKHTFGVNMLTLSQKQQCPWKIASSLLIYCIYAGVIKGQDSF